MEVIARGQREFDKVKNELSHSSISKRPFMTIPIPVRWAQFTATFRKTAVIETELGLSVVHAFYKPVHNIIGVYNKKAALGPHI